MVETILIRRVQILEPPQPLRMSMNEQALGELSDSLKRHGLLHPLIVVPAWSDEEANVQRVTTWGEGAEMQAGPLYEIVDGHRRWVAAGIAGLEQLECKVYKDLSEAKYGVMLDASRSASQVGQHNQQ